MPKRFALHSSKPEHKGAQYLIESRSEHALLAGLQGRSLHLMAEAFNWRSIISISGSRSEIPFLVLPFSDFLFRHFLFETPDSIHSNLIFVWVFASFDLESPALDHLLFL